MEIKITTYVDDEKIHEERHIGHHVEQIDHEKIQYDDKNGKKIKIFIDKIKESVSIEKDSLKTHIQYSRKKSNYSTPYGAMQLETQLVNLKKLAKNNLIMYEITYNIFFGKDDIQKNKLKILVKRS